MRNLISFLRRVEKEKGTTAKLNNRIKRAMKNKSDKLTKANFTNDVFINFQLTNARNNLAKAICDAKKARKVVKYGCDQNGKFTVKYKANDKWQVVSSVQHLEQGIQSSS